MAYAAGQKLRASDMPGSSHARYYKSVDQTGLAVGTVTGVRFNTAVDTTPDITATALFDQFTFNKAGLWMIEGASRVALGVWVSGLDRVEGLTVIAATAGSNAVRYSGASGLDIQDTNYNAGFTMMSSASTCRRFAVNDTVAYNAVVNSADSAWSITGASEQTHISFTWMGP